MPGRIQEAQKTRTQQESTCSTYADHDHKDNPVTDFKYKKKREYHCQSHLCSARTCPIERPEERYHENQAGPAQWITPGNAKSSRTIPGASNQANQRQRQKNGQGPVQQEGQIIGAAIGAIESKRRSIHIEQVAGDMKDSLNDAHHGSYQRREHQCANSSRHIITRLEIAQNQQEIKQRFDNLFTIGAHTFMQIRRNECSKRSANQKYQCWQQEEARFPPQVAHPFPAGKAFFRQHHISQHNHAKANEQSKFNERERRKTAGGERLQVEIIRKGEWQQSNGN